MIDLLYHATIYYEIRKFVQESEPAALTYEMVIEKAKAHVSWLSYFVCARMHKMI